MILHTSTFSCDRNTVNCYKVETLRLRELTSTADGAMTRNHATFQLIRVVTCPSSLEAKFYHQHARQKKCSAVWHSILVMVGEGKTYCDVASDGHRKSCLFARSVASLNWKWVSAVEAGVNNGPFFVNGLSWGGLGVGRKLLLRIQVGDIDSFCLLQPFNSLSGRSLFITSWQMRFL